MPVNFEAIWWHGMNSKTEFLSLEKERKSINWLQTFCPHFTLSLQNYLCPSHLPCPLSTVFGQVRLLPLHSSACLDTSRKNTKSYKQTFVLFSVLMPDTTVRSSFFEKGNCRESLAQSLSIWQLWSEPCSVILWRQSMPSPLSIKELCKNETCSLYTVFAEKCCQPLTSLY